MTFLTLLFMLAQLSGRPGQRSAQALGRHSVSPGRPACVCPPAAFAVLGDCHFGLQTVARGCLFLSLEEANSLSAPSAWLTAPRGPSGHSSDPRTDGQ